MTAMFDLARERGEIGSDIPPEELARLTAGYFSGCHFVMGDES